MHNGKVIPAAFIARIEQTAVSNGDVKSHTPVGRSGRLLCKFCANIQQTIVFIGKIGCPTWIRTMNNASKGRCVTITPSDNCIMKFHQAMNFTP